MKVYLSDSLQEKVFGVLQDLARNITHAGTEAEGMSAEQAVRTDSLTHAIDIPSLHPTKGMAAPNSLTARQHERLQI